MKNLQDINNTPLISRRRHYYYVMVFSVTLWMFIALFIGGFVPIWIRGTESCTCRWHPVYKNFSSIIFGISGFISGYLFTYPLHRFMLVAYSKPEDNQVPLSWMAFMGKNLFGSRFLPVIFIIITMHYFINFIMNNSFPDREGNNVHGISMLQCAAGRGDAYRVEQEIQEGTDINIGQQGQLSPLVMAIHNGHTKVATLLLDKGANPDKYALYYAIQAGDSTIVKKLIEKGIDVNSTYTIYNQSALHHATFDRVLNVAKVLLQNGARINALDNNGITPLDCTTNCIHSIETRKYLRSQGAKTGAELKAEGK